MPRAPRNSRTEKWGIDNEPIPTDWETVWSLDVGATLYSAVFVLSAHTFDFRLLVDESELFSFDLDELREEYDADDSDFAGCELVTYKSKKWIYLPRYPVECLSSLSLQLKAQSSKGTPKAVRGLSVWRPV